MAEVAGFEPATELPLCHLSRVVPSTAQPLIRIKYLKKLGISETLHYIVPSHISPNEITSIIDLTVLLTGSDIRTDSKVERSALGANSPRRHLERHLCSKLTLIP